MERVCGFQLYRLNDMVLSELAGGCLVGGGGGDFIQDGRPDLTKYRGISSLDMNKCHTPD